MDQRSQERPGRYFNFCFKLESAINLAFKKLQTSSKKGDTIRIYHQAMDIEEIFGFHENKKWIDGVFSYILRDLMFKNPDALNLFIFDGIVNPELFEHLCLIENSTAVTLKSGERIKLGKNIKIIFETSDISNLPPSIAL